MIICAAEIINNGAGSAGSFCDVDTYFSNAN